MRNYRAARLGKDGKPQITEKLFTERFKQACRLTGWRYYHTYNSMRSVKGFPDFVLVKGGLIWFVELKTETGRVSDEQTEWLEDLKRCPGNRVRILRPSGFDAFFEELKGV